MKNLTEYLNESLNKDYNFNISQIESGKLNDVKLVNEIKSNVEKFIETNISVDCGSKAPVNISFSNFNKTAKTCDLEFSMNNMSKLINVEKDIIEENLPISDAIQKCFNLLKAIKDKI